MITYVRRQASKHWNGGLEALGVERKNILYS